MNADLLRICGGTYSASSSLTNFFSVYSMCSNGSSLKTTNFIYLKIL